MRCEIKRDDETTDLREKAAAASLMPFEHGSPQRHSIHKHERRAAPTEISLPRPPLWIDTVFGIKTKTLYHRNKSVL